MKSIVRAGLLSLFIGAGGIAIGCPAGPESADAAAPAPPAASPEQVVTDVARGLSEGRPYVAWDALPASYQDDLTQLVHAYAAKVDADLWNQGFAIIRNVSSMLQNQKDIILAMPKVRASSGFDAERASREWDLVVGQVMLIADSELANAGALQQMDVRHFLATTGTEFMQNLIRISEFTADGADDKLAALRQTRATLLSRDGDAAIVEIATRGAPARTESFVRVEGKWIPEDVADDWAAEMQEARVRIAQMSPQKIEAAKPHIMSILASLDATVTRLDQAETPEQFEQTLQMGMYQAFGGMMAIAQEMEPDPEQP